MAFIHGVLCFGFVIGFIIGNSKTSVSAITVTSLLGFIGSVVTMIIEGKENNERITQNSLFIRLLVGCFAVGMFLGILGGSYMRGGEIHIFNHVLELPPINSQIPNQ